MTVTVTSNVAQPYRQTIKAGNHTFYADVAPDKGGQDTAPTPHELLLGALGACTSITMQMYANRKQWPLDEVSVTLGETKTAAAAGQPSRPQIEKKIEVKGNLTDDQLDRLKAIAEACPVNKLIMNEKQVVSTLDRMA